MRQGVVERWMLGLGCRLGRRQGRERLGSWLGKRVAEEIGNVDNDALNA